MFDQLNWRTLIELGCLTMRFFFAVFRFMKRILRDKTFIDRKLRDLNVGDLQAKLSLRKTVQVLSIWMIVLLRFRQKTFMTVALLIFEGWRASLGFVLPIVIIEFVMILLISTIVLRILIYKEKSKHEFLSRMLKALSTSELLAIIICLGLSLERAGLPLFMPLGFFIIHSHLSFYTEHKYAHIFVALLSHSVLFGVAGPAIAQSFQFSLQEVAIGYSITAVCMYLFARDGVNTGDHFSRNVFLQNLNLMQVVKRADAISVDREFERQLFAQTFDKIGNPVAIIDDNFVIKRANSAVNTMLNLAKSDLEGLKIVEFLPPDILKYDGQRRMFNWESRQYTVTLCKLDSTLPAHYGVLVFFDITDEVEFEQKKNQIQKLATIGALSSGVAHDFNNVLSIIQGDAELIELAAGEQVTIRQHATDIIETVSLGASLTRQLLSYVRKQPLSSVHISAQDLIDRVAKFGQKLLDDRYEIISNSRLGNEIIFIDPEQFETSVLNLLTNARDSMPKGGKIEISCYKTDDDWGIFQISDEGAGIPKSSLEKIFEPFMTNKPNSTNVGMGLYIVKDFVVKMGGKISIESELGVGSTVSIALPIVKDFHPANIAQVPEVDQSKLYQGYRILILDDNESFARTSVLLLSLRGANCKQTTRISELKDVEGAEQYDFVICDLALKGESGEEAYEWLTSKSFAGNWVFISGNFPPGFHAQYKDKQNVYIYEKPCSIYSILDNILEGHKSPQFAN